MTQFFDVHPKTPQTRLIQKAAEFFRKGVVVYPTDSYYALGCLQGNVDAIARLRQLRGVGEEHLMTLACTDLGQIGDYGVMDTAAFRVMKKHVPGAYTFVLAATKKVSRRLHHPRRKTVAFRVPSHPVAQALLAEVGEPIISTTLRLVGDEAPLDVADFRERLRGQVDAVIDSGSCVMVPTTVINFSENPPQLLREGGGEVDAAEEEQGVA
ncbi:L-threonylcarbamoyladenylate synthase [Candidatus Persebacteraceae bacterium Df01]|jgi:tRNA threonylcarbamoyl adenosine modification protein (Sua5/YciO/YrdC/YwlC family)|uniref:L-threonylcarbamoyladenylate synthase n=1 Tax=Candidatus Doriopsillibacter californiensis TaxID=2970740 RepID=A0ABT7QMY6_9GAMM|nr:L-threonylcarbamoyladenylate synthase [Candidatus Persebacteraceae bacterium Df01]